MPELRCPKCGTVFTVDESGYAAIADEVRNREFDKALAERLASEKAILQEKARSERQAADFEHERQLQALKAALAQTQAEKTQAVTLGQAELKAEVERLKGELAQAQDRKDLALRELKGGFESRIAEMRLEAAQALALKDQELVKAQSALEGVRKAAQAQKADLELRHQGEIRLREEQIAYYKDLKTRLSTKMLGETLEQHCQNAFNAIRASAYPRAYFEKDNDARTGSKGDFIFREATEDGLEFISIMFEMKNESDATATKHRNEDFFKELDKDRKEKGCEYAVLVSMLEADSELYNAGIVDVSWRYPKMYVVRPQCFTAIVSILRDAARANVESLRQIEAYRRENVDVTNFEKKMLEFQEKFGKQYGLAAKQFETAIAEIDKTIEHLSKVRDNLLSSGNHLRIANDRAQELSVKKLTRGNPTMAAKFEAAAKAEGESGGQNP